MAFVKVAAQNEVSKNKKISNAAISITTGLNRKEVKRLLASEVGAKEKGLQQTNRLLRVVQGWLRDPDFINDKTPKVLPYEGVNSFSELNKRYSGDMKVKALLDELESNGFVSVDENKHIRLISTEFIPKADVGKLEILGFDASQLINTINKNLVLDQKDSLFQKKVYYDHLSKEILPEFKELVNKKSMDLLVELNAWLSKHDGDFLSSPVSAEDRVGAGLGIFYFETEKEVPQ